MSGNPIDRAYAFSEVVHSVRFVNLEHDGGVEDGFGGGAEAFGVFACGERVGAAGEGAVVGEDGVFVDALADVVGGDGEGSRAEGGGEFVGVGAEDFGDDAHHEEPPGRIARGGGAREVDSFN